MIKILPGEITSGNVFSVCRNILIKNKIYCIVLNVLLDFMLSFVPILLSCGYIEDDVSCETLLLKVSFKALGNYQIKVIDN